MYNMSCGRQLLGTTQDPMFYFVMSSQGTPRQMSFPGGSCEAKTEFFFMLLSFLPHNMYRNWKDRN